MTGRLFAAACLLLALTLPARAGGDLTGLWETSFLGNSVVCHLEQRGEYLYGAAFVTTRSGERNAYHLAGLIVNGKIVAMHGSGHVFKGECQGADTVAGEFTFKDGPTVNMQAKRIQRGKTHPEGLKWPEGFGPGQ